MSCPSFPGCSVAPVDLESIAGTAPNEEAYLILEMAKPWPAKIKKAEGVVEGIRKVLKKHKSEDFKLLATPEITWLPQAQEPRALVIRWDGKQALCEVLSPATPESVKASISGPVKGEPKQFYMVCTHGSRDPCCGLKGVPIYRALEQAAGRKTLQVSHLGGHRFAPVLLSMPEWKFYGHLTPETALELDHHLCNDKPYLNGYRGHGRLKAAVQLMEAKLWAEYGSSLDEVKFVGGDKKKPLIQATLKSGETLHYEADVEYFRYEGYKSCKDFRKEKVSDLKLPRLKSMTETSATVG